MFQTLTPKLEALQKALALKPTTAMASRTAVANSATSATATRSTEEMMAELHEFVARIEAEVRIRRDRVAKSRKGHHRRAPYHRPQSTSTIIPSETSAFVASANKEYSPRKPTYAASTRDNSPAKPVGPPAVPSLVADRLILLMDSNYTRYPFRKTPWAPIVQCGIRFKDAAELVRAA